MERSAAQLVAVHAAVAACACFVPIDPAFPAARISYILRHCGATILLTDGSVAQQAPTLPHLCSRRMRTSYSTDHRPAHPCIRTHKHTHSRTHSYTHTLTHSHTHARIHSYTHTLTHSHTHTLTNHHSPITTSYELLTNSVPIDSLVDCQAEPQLSSIAATAATPSPHWTH